ncbi:MAG: OsmC family protein [Chitinophagales bacterium]|nr:OsmC family protein [Chitinophagales bacterium]
MHTSKIEYLGELRTEATHLQSGNQIITDAPTDNHGKGEAFSPTDLVATALGSCMISIMGIKLLGSGKDIKGATVDVTKVMYSEPRRIGEIHVKINVPDDSFSDKEKQILINAAHACPVAKSLHPDIKQIIEIIFS